MLPMTKRILLLAGLAPMLACSQEHGEPPVKAPFAKGEDSLCVNDWWNRPAPARPRDRILDLKVPRDQVLAFGLYTVMDGKLKLSAQLYPLYPEETRTVRLEIEKAGEWQEIAREEVNDLGWSALFEVADWPADRDVRYRLRHGERAMFEGLVRRDPKDKNEIVLAALSCNSNQDRGMRENYVRNINHQDPDLVFFAGDQSYDHKEHTAAWLKFGLQFREVFRNRPCISIPDDHDIGQGNLWGEGGKRAELASGTDRSSNCPAARC